MKRETKRIEILTWRRPELGANFLVRNDTNLPAGGKANQLDCRGPGFQPVVLLEVLGLPSIKIFWFYNKRMVP